MVYTDYFFKMCGYEGEQRYEALVGWCYRQIGVGEFCFDFWCYRQIGGVGEGLF